MAVQDYMRPPAATAPDASGYRGRAGDAIRVQATDDFGVAGVQGRILAPGGALLEEGPACAGRLTMSPREYGLRWMARRMGAVVRALLWRTCPIGWCEMPARQTHQHALRGCRASQPKLI